MHPDVFDITVTTPYPAPPIRYGENIKEVNADPEWECPSCRDICNCSFCRLRKGWQPTGTMYRKVSRRGRGRRWVRVPRQ